MEANLSLASPITSPANRPGLPIKRVGLVAAIGALLSLA